MKKKNNFIVQGGILAIAGVIARLIGIARRIPMEHIIGDVGNGYYAVAYEIYNIMLLISCYSLPLAVSKVVSKKVSKKQYVNVQRVLHCALAFAIVAGCITFACVEFFGDFLTGTIMSQPMSGFAVKVLGPALLLVSVMGVFRGYFQGLGTMVPTAVSQILEQIFVVIFSIGGAYLFYQKGIKVGALLHNENYAPSYGAAGASLGPVAGAAIGLLFLLFIYYSYRSLMVKNTKSDVSGKEDSYGSLLRLIILTAIPVLLSTTIYNISPIIDQGMFNKIMTQKGLGDNTAYYLGVYSGKYKVLITVPIALASAMCSSIVPVLTGLMDRRDYNTARERINQGVRFTMIIAIPSAVGLGILARPIISMLFKEEVELAVKLLHIGAISVVLTSLSTLTSGVLQGINKMKIPVINALIALIAHIVFLYVTLQMGLGIHAVVYSNILFSVIVCILNGMAIRKYLKYEQEIIKTFVIPTISATIMGVVLAVISFFVGDILGNIITVIISLILGVIVYFVSLIMAKGVSADDLKKMPGGRTVLTVARKCRLIE